MLIIETTYFYKKLEEKMRLKFAKQAIEESQNIFSDKTRKTIKATETD